MYRRAVRVVGFFVWAHGLTMLAASMPALADIYRYVDSQGVMHFSNVPTSPRYQIYLLGTPSGGEYEPSRLYDPFIAEAARRYGLPFSLIKAIIKVESNFNPYAVSSAGARGLMQIMPITATALGVRDSFDPRENILAGARYLRALLRQFRHSLPLALAAYNAGPDKVVTLRRVPPIKETRRFVRKVMEYYEHGYQW